MDDIDLEMDVAVSSSATRLKLGLLLTARMIGLAILVYIFIQAILVSISLSVDTGNLDDSESYDTSNLFSVSTSRFIFYMVIMNCLRGAALLSWIGEVWQVCKVCNIWIFQHLMWAWIPVLIESFTTAVILVINTSFKTVPFSILDSRPLREAIFSINQLCWFVLLTTVGVSFCFVGRSPRHQ